MSSSIYGVAIPHENCLNVLYPQGLVHSLFKFGSSLCILSPRSRFSILSCEASDSVSPFGFLLPWFRFSFRQSRLLSGYCYVNAWMILQYHVFSYCYDIFNRILFLEPWPSFVVSSSLSISPPSSNILPLKRSSRSNTIWYSFVEDIALDFSSFLQLSRECDDRKRSVLYIRNFREAQLEMITGGTDIRRGEEAARGRRQREVSEKAVRRRRNFYGHFCYWDAAQMVWCCTSHTSHKLSEYFIYP